jgi:hypothetical protein
MSDLPPSASNGHHPHPRRNPRRRAGVGASSHKKSTPPQAEADKHLEPSKKASIPTQAGADNAETQLSRPVRSAKLVEPTERADEATLSTKQAEAQQAEVALAGAAGQKGARWSRLTPISRQILLWGAIAGFAIFVLSTGSQLLLGQLAPDQQTANHNQTAIQTTVCLSDIVTLALFAFGGIRAVARIGLPRHGGMAGAWASVVALLLGLVVCFILLAFIPAASAGNQGSLGQDVVNTLSAALFNIGLGFGAGWVGGRYSEWKRKKALRQQEAAVAS